MNEKSELNSTYKTNNYYVNLLSISQSLSMGLTKI